MKKLIFIVLIAGCVYAYFNFTIFVIPPTEAHERYPKGETIVIERFGILEFIESPDSVCLKSQGGVNWICRIAILGVVDGNNPEVRVAKQIIRLPYLDFLYLVSTGGQDFRPFNLDFSF